jgi:hypothetical protein
MGEVLLFNTLLLEFLSLVSNRCHGKLQVIVPDDKIIADKIANVVFFYSSFFIRVRWAFPAAAKQSEAAGRVLRYSPRVSLTLTPPGYRFAP